MAIPLQDNNKSGLLRSIGLLAGLTAGSIAMPGCDDPAITNQQGQPIPAVRTLPKEARFSTIADDAKIALTDMEANYTVRLNLSQSLETAKGLLPDVVADILANNSLSDSKYQALSASLQKAMSGISAAVEDPNMAAARTKLGDLDKSIKGLQALSADDFKGSNFRENKGYIAAQAVLKTLSEWDSALNRDLLLLDGGTKAAFVAKLHGTIDGVEKSLQPLVDQATSDQWLKDNQTTVDSMRKEVEGLKKMIDEARSLSRYRPYFAPVQDDLDDVNRLLGDVLVVTTSDSYSQYWNRGLGKPKSDGQMVIDETLKLLAAVKEDNMQELQKSVGAVPPAPQAPGTGANNVTNPNATIPGTGAGTVVHHHHGSGNDLMLWYLLLNRNTGGSPVYMYPPATSSYSDPERLRNSGSYNTFSRQSQETAKSVTAAPGSTLSSRPAAGLARPSFSSRSATSPGTGSSSSGLSGGASSSSGSSFSSQGASKSSGGSWLGGSSRSSGSSPGGFGGTSGGRSVGG